MTENTFGFLTTTDTISQNQIDQTTENGWITGMYTTMYDGLTDLLAPKTNPTFLGAMTFPDGKVISQTTEDTTFWKDVTFNGTVTFPDTSTITDYLKSATAATTYLTPDTASSTHAPKASPTVTGTVTFPDTSTITDYLKSATASCTYLTTLSATSTYAPKVSPTFTGNIVLNGNVTLAETSANSLGARWPSG